ncbi:MAG: hypothetical protein J6A56_02830 [Clostridia bacterium]|nr:hypothetical protein [Clostridia bacterium]
MVRKDVVISVCQRCGAVGSVKQPHCVFCGAALNAEMQVRLRKDRGSFAIKKDSISSGTGIARKKVTVTSLLSLFFGVGAVLMLAFRVLDGGLLLGILSMILAIVALCQRKGGALLSAVAIGLGIYTMFVNLFWFFYNLFIFF